MKPITIECSKKKWSCGNISSWHVPETRDHNVWKPDEYFLNSSQPICKGREIFAPRPPMHFLHKTFPGTIDKISHCAKFHISSCLVSWLPKIRFCSLANSESSFYSQNIALLNSQQSTALQFTNCLPGWHIPKNCIVCQTCLWCHWQVSDVPVKEETIKLTYVKQHNIALPLKFLVFFNAPIMGRKSHFQCPHMTFGIDPRRFPPRPADYIKSSTFNFRKINLIKFWPHLNMFIYVWDSPFSPLVPTVLRRGQAQIVKDSSSSYKIHYITVIKNFLNPEGQPNCITGSKVRPFYWRGGICLLVELHREGSAPAACAAGLLSI